MLNAEKIKQRVLGPLILEIKKLPRITLIKHYQGRFIACPCGNIDQNEFSYYAKPVLNRNVKLMACLCEICKLDTLGDNLILDGKEIFPGGIKIAKITKYYSFRRALKHFARLTIKKIKDGKSKIKIWGSRKH